MVALFVIATIVSYKSVSFEITIAFSLGTLLYLLNSLISRYYLRKQVYNIVLIYFNAFMDFFVLFMVRLASVLFMLNGGDYAIKEKPLFVVNLLTICLGPFRYNSRFTIFNSSLGILFELLLILSVKSFSKVQFLDRSTGFPLNVYNGDMLMNIILFVSMIAAIMWLS